jgi:sterol desaturase/sphingolipid hydroxylase (fatty acid hydroxylase superfamily)
MNILVRILTFALPAVIVIATLEGLVLAFVMRRNYNWRAYLASLADALGRQYIVLTFFTLSLAAPAFDLARSHRLFTIQLDSAVAVVALLVGQDFCYYWLHRCSHRIRWFWATHAVHHSSNDVNLAAAYRFGWTGRLTGASIFYVPLVWLGFEPTPVFIANAVNLLYQFWLHTEWIPKLGWLEYVLNTPSHHRVHHAANPEYLDHNYGGVFIIFDRMFGTFVAERDDLPCRYGLVQPLLSNNGSRSVAMSGKRDRGGIGGRTSLVRLAGDPIAKGRYPGPCCCASQSRAPTAEPQVSFLGAAQRQ